MVRDCFLKGIVALCFSDSFSPDSLKRNKGIESLGNLFSDTELKNIKEYLADGRDNVNFLIKKVPEY